METHFQLKDIAILLFGLVFIFTSIFLFLKEQVKISILFLTCGAFILRFFIINLDPFLYLWDEQFHALVAKNIMDNPFKTMLYVQPVLPYKFGYWAGDHIWLYKGPVFLWLIAISLKIFGVNEIAVRIPSLIMSTLMVPILFRLGKIIINEKAGYFTAFLFATANYQIEMVSGIIGSDHNDVAFMFFICCSFWAWCEYRKSVKTKWLIAVGIFSGLAVLTKWFAGFLVFFCWLLTIFMDKEKRNQFEHYGSLIKSFTISLIISLSWFIYAFYRFPAEMVAIFVSYTQHFTTVTEAHSGGGYYYLDLLPEQYGWFTPFIILPALYFLYKELKGKKELMIFLFSSLLSVHLFYAIAKYKMPLYVNIVCPVIFLALGNFLLMSINFAKNYIRNYVKVFTFILIFLIGFFNIGIGEIEGHHTGTGLWVDFRNKNIHNTEIFRKIGKEFPNKDLIIFNCKDFNAIPVMFYTGMTAYPDIPDSNTFSNLKKEGYKLAVIDDGKLPAYILKDSRIKKLDYKIE